MLSEIPCETDVQYIASQWNCVDHGDDLRGLPREKYADGKTYTAERLKL
jgi:hypothetical protein